MEKKISMKEEQAIDWLKSEIKKDQVELDLKKKQLIESLKGFNKEDIVKVEKPLTLWKRIKKVVLG